MRYLVLLLSLLLCSCTTAPPRFKAVDNFEISRYTGTWYEIARLDHSFERGLEPVYAEYTPRSDGGIDVINRGYDPQKKIWRQANGRAYFTAAPTTGSLKVSFFRPFYGAYNILTIDPDYRYALVAGDDLNYLWFLSREKTIPTPILETYLQQAADAGFAVEKLIYPRQTTAP